MARMIKSVLGKVTGALGDLVFRQVGDQSIIAVRPASFMPGTDQASIDRRSKFRLASKLAQSINLIDELYQVWDEVSSERSSFQSAFSANYPYIIPDGTAGNFMVTPRTGFGVSNPIIAVSPTEIQAEIDPLGNDLGIDTTEEKTVRLVGVMYLNNPIDPYAPSNQFLEVNSAELPLQTTAPLVFSVPLLNQDAELCKLYADQEVYFALVTLDEEGNVIHYSNTFRRV